MTMAPSTVSSDVSNLKIALDPSRMLDLLRSRFQEFKEDFDLIEINIANVSYQSATRCTILYHLKVRKRGAESFFTQILTGRTLDPGDSPVFPDNRFVTRYRQSARFILRSPVVYFSDIRLLLQSFPLDPTLTWLFDAYDPETMKPELSRFCGGKKVKLKKIRPKVLSYQPDMRATLLYNVQCLSKESNEITPRAFVGKIHIHKDAARLFARSWALSQAANGSLRMAQPVGYLPAYRLFLQEKVEGKRLGNVVDSPDLAGFMRETARQIAALHRLRIPLLSHRTAKVEAAFVSRWIKVLIDICPEMAARIEDLGKRVISGILARTKVCATVHGDFQNTNALVHEGKVTLIDLDEVAHGDPLSDVGRLLSSMRIPALRQFGTFSAIEKAQNAFMEEYLRQNPEDERRARLFEAGSLIVSAASTYRQQRPEWRREIPLLLDEAEQALGRSQPTEPITVPVDMETNHLTLPFEDRLVWAMHTPYIQAVLQSHIHTLYEALITSCQITNNYATNTRFRVRYKLVGFRRGQKWQCSLQAVSWKKQTGRNLWFRLNELNQALEEDEKAPVLPKPVAYLSYFPLVVLEYVSGPSLASVLRSPKCLEGAEKMAFALASFHNSQVKFNRVRPVEGELVKFRKRVKNLKMLGQADSEKILALLGELEKSMAKVPEKITPVLRKVRPHRIFYHGNRIIFTEFEWLSCSHPFIDAASFLSHLTLMQFRSKKPEEIEKAADHFRSTYLRATDGNLNHLALFESFYLLRALCTQITSNEPKLADQLFAAAKERVQNL